MKPAVSNVITSGSIDEILDFLDERFNGQTRLLQFFFVGVQVLPKVGTVRQTFRELQRQQPHSEQVTLRLIKQTQHLLPSFLFRVHGYNNQPVEFRRGDIFDSLTDEI